MLYHIVKLAYRRGVRLRILLLWCVSPLPIENEVDVEAQLEKARIGSRLHESGKRLPQVEGSCQGSGREDDFLFYAAEWQPFCMAGGLDGNFHQLSRLKLAHSQPQPSR